MKVKVDGILVDVRNSECPKRPCFELGFDKGSFSPGRGYTSYHRDKKGKYVEYPVCFTRHLHGCPVNSSCPKCHSASTRQPGEPCDGTWEKDCPGILVGRRTPD